MKNCKGFSLIEVVVPMSFVAVLGGLASTGLGDHGSFSDEPFVATAAERTAIQATVTALTARSLDVVRANVSLGDAHGLNVVRDGVILRSAGRDSVVALAIMPEDRDADGVQDYIDMDRDGRPDDVVGNRDGQIDGYADLKWQLVMQEFANIDAAMDVTRWSGAQVLARSLVPVVTAANGQLEYDTLGCEHTTDVSSCGMLTMKLVQAHSARRNRILEDYTFFKLTTSTDDLLSTQGRDGDQAAQLADSDAVRVHG